MSLSEGSTSKSRDKSPYKGIESESAKQILIDLVKKRGILKARLTKFASQVHTICGVGLEITRENRIDLKLRLTGAENLFSEFCQIQSQIEETVDASCLDDQLTQREQFENTYYGALTNAETSMHEDEDNDPCSSKCNGNFQRHSVKLPTIPMPTFDGAFSAWIQFRDKYVSLIHNNKDLPDIQKFHYLKTSLSGSAALVIDAMEFSAVNYNVAWGLLLNRYNNNRLLIHNHVKTLFTIEQLNKESHTSIRNLIDTTLKTLRTLKVLGEPTEYWDTLVIYLIVSKLDKITEREWEQYKSTLFSDDHDAKLKVDDLIKFLTGRADMLETLQVTRTKDTHTDNKKSFTVVQKSQSHCNVSNDRPQAQDRQRQSTKSQYRYERLCFACKQGHPIYSCRKFLDSDLETKLNLIRENKLCENCLRGGHTADLCKYGPCKKCYKKHNSLIHTDSDLVNSSSSTTMHSSLTYDAHLLPVVKPSPVSGVSGPSNSLSLKSHSMQLQPVLLSTALVEVLDNNNVYHLARALLDCGSQRCFITQSLCDLINTPKIQSTHEIHGIGNSVTQSTQMCEINLKSRTSTYTTHLKCFVLPHITTVPIAYDTQNTHLEIPDHVQLADPDFLACQTIDILIGADVFWDLLSTGKLRLKNGPYLQDTKLGWIISGSVSHQRTQRRKMKPETQADGGSIQCNFTHTLDSQLRQFWEIEELPNSKVTQTDDERACEDHFVASTTRDSNGRFIVSIPFKQSPEVLGDSYNQAERRFLSLEKRLQRNKKYNEMYQDFIREYESLGHMTRIQAHEVNSPHYFLPHHGVLREHSTTTKLRVVFDASAASSSNLSLNDLQLVGPPIQGDLIAILLRFRQHRFVACADVEKMYRQCLISGSGSKIITSESGSKRNEFAGDQRHLQLILWRDDPSQPISIFRLNTVTYGTASAPYLSCRCLKQLAVDCSNPDVSRVINEDFYVDDLISGNDDQSQLLHICHETAKTLQSGCFPLRKWIFNFQPDESVLKDMHDTTSLKQFTLTDNSGSKTLGLGWHNTQDEFHFDTHFEIFNNNQTITKRTILSHVSQIFDPLGFLSPSIMQAKILLQRLWLLKLGWDDQLPSDVTRTWDQFVTSLASLSTIRVPRYVIGRHDSSAHIHTELHIFVDASQVGYGTCAYVRTINHCDATASAQLLCSKGKVAPLKPVSIPRLELCGALLGARLFEKIKNSLHHHFAKIMFWTDSTIVLGWLRMKPNLLKTFVQNRVVEIHDLTKELSWQHVSGKENPADLVSRGSGLVELSGSRLWFEGPEFLRNFNFDSSQTKSIPGTFIPDDLPEVKTSVTSLTAVTPESIFPFHRFSQFHRMVRAAAYMLRFINNTRNKNNRRAGAITVEELRESERTLIKLSQLESYPDEYRLIASTRTLKQKHNLSKLNLFIDKHKILRVGGRIENSSQFSYDKKHPILLSSKHHFTLLLFRHEHKNLLHAAPQALLFHLRDTWWPVGGRNLARKVNHQCVICTRLTGKTLTPLMGNLPSERITPTYPFSKCGVDYAGPVYVLNRKGRGAQTVKAYICLFVCFVTRAIHLELVGDLSSDAYLLALKRFISRRAKPAEIFSDNGRNFVGLKNEFERFLSSCSKDIIDYATSQHIKFRFIVPYAAHWGGLWERGVRSCKYHLRRVIGNAHLTFEEFSTVLTQIEAVLNSRPLSPLSTDPHDYLPLTPAHFLVGRALTAPCSDDQRHTPQHRLDRYQRVEQLRQHFWSRWAKEYVSELQTRIKWREHIGNLEPNTMVVIKDDNLPPLKWHLGRIVDTILGKDGVSRAADIQTTGGVVRRAYSKICPLFHEDTHNEAEES